MGYTKSAKTEALDEQWYVVDAKDQVLGRLATDITHVLRGKHLPNFTPHVNMRTHVIVLNADKVALTGRKLVDKKYYWHTGYIGGIKEYSAEQLNARHPGDLVRRAVWGMMPKTRLGRASMKRLRIYASEDHPHQAQQPEPLPSRQGRRATS